MAWWAKAQQAIHVLPDNFGGYRSLPGEDWKSIPFSTKTEDKVTYVALPSNEPDPVLLPAFGALIEICTYAGYRFTESTCKDYRWNSFAGIKDGILGAHYCLKRESITPVDNVPANLKVGWDFALWYCQAAVSKETGPNDYFSIHRVTSLVATLKGGSQWNVGGQLTEISRLTNLVRVGAQARAPHLSETKKFLKGLGYFLERLVGKKPIGGLYTDLEFEIVKKDWQARTDKVTSCFNQLPKLWSDLNTPAGISVYFEQLQKAGARKTKDIEETRSSRIPNLLVPSPRGRSKIPVIAPGGSLPEKLQFIEGGKSVRTIGKTLWSPRDGITQSVFLEMSMNIAKHCWLQRGLDPIVAMENRIKTFKKDFTEEYLLLDKAQPQLLTAALTYLEVIPERSSDPAWVAFFGTPPG